MFFVKLDYNLSKIDAKNAAGRIGPAASLSAYFEMRSCERLVPIWLNTVEIPDDEVTV